MNEQEALALMAAQKHRRHWLKRFILILLPLLLLALATPALLYYWKVNTLLDEAVAEADRQDPGWRLDDLEAKRAVVSPDENSSPSLIKAKGLMPPDWPFYWNVSSDRMKKLSDSEREELIVQLQGGASDVIERNVQYSPQALAALRSEVKRAEEAVREARTLAGRPRGRHPITYAPDGYSTVFPFTQDVRGVANLLSEDASLRAHDGDAHGALEDCRAIINGLRCVGDEPFLISMLVRIAIHHLACEKVERIIGLTEPDEKDLQQIQAMLEEEIETPLFLIGTRGERAMHHRFLEALAKGEANMAMMTGGAGSADLFFRWAPGLIKRDTAAILHFDSQMVEIAKRPPEKQRDEVKALVATHAGDLSVLQRLLLPAYEKVSEASIRDQAQLRCTLVMVAAERYRKKKGHWPESLNDLVPAHLRALPIDPFDGKPLRMKRTENGLLIYSVGPDGVDNQGYLGKHNYQAGTDMGRQLWDVKERRLPYRPPPKVTQPASP
jgi:hypothetical protein